MALGWIRCSVLFPGAVLILYRALKIKEKMKARLRTTNATEGTKLWIIYSVSVFCGEAQPTHFCRRCKSSAASASLKQPVTLQLVSMHLDSLCPLWQAGLGLGPGVSLWEGHITHKGEWGKQGEAERGSGYINIISKDMQRKSNSSDVVYLDLGLRFNEKQLLVTRGQVETNLCLIRNMWVTVFSRITAVMSSVITSLTLTHVNVVSAAHSLGCLHVHWQMQRAPCQHFTVQSTLGPALSSEVRITKMQLRYNILYMLSGLHSITFNMIKVVSGQRELNSMGPVGCVIWSTPYCTNACNTEYVPSELAGAPTLVQHWTQC